MAGGTTIVDRLNKLSGKDATTIAKALENLEEGGGIGGFEIHICASGEYDAETKVPTIEEPDSSTLYLVPTTEEAGDLFDEYIWTGEAWERFGAGSVNIQNPDWNESDPTSAAYIENRPFYYYQPEEILYEGDLAFDQYAGSNYYGSNEVTFSRSVSFEETITLNVDGLEYTDTVSSNHQYIGAANPGDSNITTTKVGVFLTQNGANTFRGMSWRMVSSSERSAGTYHVKVSIKAEPIIKQIDNVFLKNSNVINGRGVGSIRSASAYEEYESYSMPEGCVALGCDTYAYGGKGAHAEGINSVASKLAAHAEGESTLADGSSAHSEGYNTQAKGSQSHAEGFRTIAKNKAQHVFGRYNVQDPSSYGNTNFGRYVEIVGNGESENTRSNARTLDWYGNEQLRGSLTLGMGTADEVTVTAAQLKALIALLNA